MKALFAKQPRSYWLSSLGLLIVLLAVWILFGMLLRLSLDFQRNTQPRLERHQSYGEAKNRESMAIDTLQYLEPRRVLWATPQGAVLVPVAFALALNPIVECESRWDPDAVGDAGELGLAQVHVRVHGPRMESMGLDPQVERDRMIFAVALWRERGTQDWSCAQ